MFPVWEYLGNIKFTVIILTAAIFDFMQHTATDRIKTLKSLVIEG